MTEELTHEQKWDVMMNQFDNHSELHGSFDVTWSVTGCGFGQFHFYKKDEKTYCANENMSKEFIKKVLNQMVDDCILEDVRE